MIKDAVKDGHISQKQSEKLPHNLLVGIIKKKKKGVDEERKKIGKEAHKRGRPKGGSKVKIVK